MLILFIGNFTEIQPPQKLMQVFETFLQFAIDLGKLHPDYKLYGDRQMQENTSSPGHNLFEALKRPPFDKHFDFNITEPEPCTFACHLQHIYFEPPVV